MQASATARTASLSPSRAADFMQCPLLYRFRVIDKLPEAPSAAATRGTVVHAVLERVFDAPAGQRSVPRARSMVVREWERLLKKRPELAQLFPDESEGAQPGALDAERLARWLTEAEELVERWFSLEDPTRLQPAERELWVETKLESGLRLRGVIDRVDIAPTGEVRIVDYKTGKAPRPEYAGDALFQMKFYALVLWRLRGEVPKRLQLVYLGSGDVLTLDPQESELLAVERKLLALWEAIRRATETGDWRPKPGRLCGWCDHQAHCPEFGGTPPPYPLTIQPALPLEMPGQRTGEDRDTDTDGAAGPEGADATADTGGADGADGADGAAGGRDGGGGAGADGADGAAGERDGGGGAGAGGAGGDLPAG